MAESRIVKVRLNKSYENKLKIILQKYGIEYTEKGADSMGLRIAIDLAMTRLPDIPTDVIDFSYRVVSQAHHIRGKKRKRKPKQSVYNIEPTLLDADDFGV